MPRNGSGVFSKVAGTTAVASTTIESAKYNSVIDDIAADLNIARPIVAGGTGATTAAAAFAALAAGGMPYGSVTAPGLPFDSDSNTGIYRPNANEVGLATNGVAGLRVTASNVTAYDTVTAQSLRLSNTTDIALAGSTMALQIGATASQNLTIDNNEMQVRNNGAAGTCGINRLGGDVNIGDNTTGTTIKMGGILDTSSEMIATFTDAITGAISTRFMTPLRTANAITALRPTYTSAVQTITSAGLLTLAHGLSVKPIAVQLILECQTGEAGYSAGDWVYIAINTTRDTAGGSASAMTGVYCTATNINVRFSSNASAFGVAHKTTGADTALTNGNWKLVVSAIA